jgi:hypothetical protein
MPPAYGGVAGPSPSNLRAERDETRAPSSIDPSSWARRTWMVPFPQRDIAVTGVLASHGRVERTTAAMVGVLALAAWGAAGRADAQRDVARVEPMAASPSHQTMCAHGCSTLARRRVGSTRVRVVDARNGRALAAGSTLWLVVETPAGVFARVLAEDGVECGFDRPIAVSARFESLTLVDFEGGATPEIFVDWIYTADGRGGGVSLACSLEHTAPLCVAALPRANVDLSTRSFVGRGRIRYGAPDTDVLVSFAAE